MALNGISALVKVATMKADVANQDALAGAAQQRGTRQALHDALLSAPVGLGPVKSKLEEASTDLQSQDKLLLRLGSARGPSSWPRHA